MKIQKVTAFFDSAKVMSLIPEPTRKWLNWAGGLTRKIARRSLRPARQKKLSEMTDKEKERYQKQIAWAEKNNLPKPRRPEVSAAEWEPPLLHSKKSPLKYLLYYGLDLAIHTVLIGPVRAKSAIAGVLEHGGVSNGRQIKPHPFMQPALDAVVPQLDDYWKNLITN